MFDKKRFQSPIDFEKDLFAPQNQSSCKSKITSAVFRPVSEALKEDRPPLINATIKNIGDRYYNTIKRPTAPARTPNNLKLISDPWQY